MNGSSSVGSVCDRVAAMASTDDVKKLAALSRLDIPEAELEAFAGEFDAILGYVGKLDELELVHGAPTAGAVRNVMREDGEPHETGRYTEKLAEQFPAREGNHLSVKKIISYD